MPSTDTEQLVVLLEARIRDFEKNMAKASGTAGREFGAIERRGQQSAKRVEGLFGNVGKNINGSLRGFGGGLLAGGIAGLISEATVRQLGAAVKSVADMADEAERIKLPVEDFQALGFVARQAGIEAGNVTDLFQKFQLAVALPTAPRMAAIVGGQVVISSTVNVTVPNGGGGKENHDALAKTVSKQVEVSIRGMIQKEIISQRRAGNSLNPIGG